MVKEIKKKKPRAERKPNPVAIIAAMVAAISAFLPLFIRFGMFAGMPNSVVLGLVAIVGGLLAFFNIKWAFLAGAFNVTMVIIELIIRIGHVSSDYIRQVLVSVLPIPVIFITASVIFIIATVRYLKAPQYQNNQ